MELIIGPIVSLGVSLLKRVGEKLGVELTKSLVLLVVLLCAIITSALVNQGIITKEFIQTAGLIFLSAIGYYEAITKEVINPILDKI